MRLFIDVYNLDYEEITVDPRLELVKILTIREHPLACIFHKAATLEKNISIPGIE